MTNNEHLPQSRHHAALHLSKDHKAYKRTTVFTSFQRKQTKKPKMGAEKVTMNIVVVGQVQSAKAIKSVAKATPATSQLMLAGGWCGLGDGDDGLGRLDLSDNDDVHGYFFCAHFGFVDFTLILKKQTKKSKMGAEKVTMNIVVVGQVQSAKAIKSVAKATPATSQLMSC
ncbi:hypothetical protein ACI65C_007396 [Semiaphis heraclei]